MFALCVDLDRLAASVSFDDDIVFREGHCQRRPALRRLDYPDRHAAVIKPARFCEEISNGLGRGGEVLGTDYKLGQDENLIKHCCRGSRRCWALSMGGSCDVANPGSMPWPPPHVWADRQALWLRLTSMDLAVVLRTAKAVGKNENWPNSANRLQTG